jgi:hypothetical protein
VTVGGDHARGDRLGLERGVSLERGPVDGRPGTLAERAEDLRQLADEGSDRLPEEAASRADVAPA